MQYSNNLKEYGLIKNPLKYNPLTSGGGDEGLFPPPGYLFLVDDDGDYLIDNDGAYLVTTP